MTGTDADDAPMAASLDAVRQVLSEDRTLTLDDVADQADIPTADLEALFDAAIRLQDDGRYGDADLQYARSLRSMLKYESVERVARLLRLRMRAMFQLAINDASAITSNPAVEAIVNAGVDPEALGGIIASVSNELLPAVESQLALDYRAALLRMLNTEIVSRVSADVTRPVEMAVGFADLVGFTQLSAATTLEGIDDVLDHFDELAHQAVHDVDEVLIAKTIGDAVMLVGSDANAVAQALWTIVNQHVEALDGVPRRAGMDYGEVVVREGDYVGTTVNRAARLTDVARPGALLIAEDSAERLDDQRWSLRHLRPMMLKGLGHSRPYRVRQALDDGEPRKER